MPHRETAEALLARWREAERRHADTAPGTPEFEETRLDVVVCRSRYQQAVEETQELEVQQPQPAPSGAD